MHYCLNCGIELAPTEDVCPLCYTHMHTKADDTHRAYPSNCEAVPLKNPHTALVGLIILLIPSLCCLAIDFFNDGLISWVLYVWGGEACVFTYIFIPKLFRKLKISLCLIISSAVTVGYLFLIGYLSSSVKWVLPLGMPITFMTGLMIFAVLRVLKIKKVSKLLKSAVIIGLAGLFVIAVEAVIDIYELGTLTLGWALPVLLPLACISAALLYIEYNSGLKDRLQRAVYLALYI